MATPFEDMLQTLVNNKSVQPNDVPKFRSNYLYFEDQRSRILGTYSHQWVAAVNGVLYADPTLARLERMIQSLPDSPYAYVERIP